MKRSSMIKFDDAKKLRLSKITLRELNGQLRFAVGGGTGQCDTQWATCVCADSISVVCSTDTNC